MFPKNLKELQDLIIRIWRPSIDSLRRTKQDNKSVIDSNQIHKQNQNYECNQVKEIGKFHINIISS